MPNNGIISRYATVPEEFKVNTTNEFDNTTDTIVVNKALNGIKVEQKAVTLNQLAGMIGGGEAGPQGPMGPAGPAGPAVPSGLDWRGAYNNSTAYELNDVVTWVNPDTDILGSYWVTATGGVTGVSPTNGSGVINTGWAFLASQGPQGPVGPAGPQGNVGPQGPAGTATLPYSEFSTRFAMAGSSMPPSPSSFIIGSAINQFGLTSTNVGISQSAPGMLNITFPAGTFSLASAKNVLTISQDVDSSWNGNRLWMVKFVMQGFASTPTIFLQVFMWDGTAWVTNFTETVALRLTYRKYN
jgi:hypothetical protein